MAWKFNSVFVDGSLQIIGPLYVNASIGIGISIPGQALDVLGRIRSSDASGAYMDFYKTLNGEGVITTSEQAFSFQPASGLAYIYRPSVDSQFRVYSSNGTNNYINIRHDSINSIIESGIGNLTINASTYFAERVGIGTAASTHALDVSGSVIVRGLMIGDEAVRTRMVGTINQMSADTQIRTFPGYDTIIGADYSGAEFMRVTSTGNVGIATPSPTYTLDVSGNFHVSGSMLDNSTKLSSSSGVSGQVYYDASYLYICTSTNKWGRVLLETSF